MHDAGKASCPASICFSLFMRQLVSHICNFIAFPHNVTDSMKTTLLRERSFPFELTPAAIAGVARSLTAKLES
jgi:hypothetical protein